MMFWRVGLLERVLRKGKPFGVGAWALALLAPFTIPIGARADNAEGDVRVSDMGPNGDVGYGAFHVRSAYNSVNDEFLVVWLGDDNTAPLVNGEFEVFGQRIEAATGSPIGANDFRISDMGSDSETSPTVRDNFSVAEVQVAYNPADNEYLVVWIGDDNTAPLADGEMEVFGQRIDGATGTPLGANDFRISAMGGSGNNGFNASNVAIAYNGVENEYLVVWSGDDNRPPLVNGEFEIFGRRIHASTGVLLGEDYVRISDMGNDAETNATIRNDFEAVVPRVAYNPTLNEYLVVWQGDDDTGALADNAREIFGQRLSGATLAELGANDFRISDMGMDDASTTFAAWEPDVAFDPEHNEYLVVWRGDDDTPPLVDEEWEVFAQRLDGTSAAELGQNDLRVSDMGNDVEADPAMRDDFVVSEPRVVFNITDGEFLIVWAGSDDTPPLVANELEVFAQRLTAGSGMEVGTNDFRLSDMGDDGESDGGLRSSFRVTRPSVSLDSENSTYLIAWEGNDDDTNLSDSTLVVGEVEAFVRYFQLPNSPPMIAEGDELTVSMDEDGDPDVFELSLAATDADGDTLSWSVSQAANHGRRRVMESARQSRCRTPPKPTTMVRIDLPCAFRTVEVALTQWTLWPT